MKAKDSKVIDSESKGRAESAKTLDSEKWDLESSKLESATDSQKIDCHAGLTPARNDDTRLDEKKKESNEVYQASEVKTADSKAIDSESQRGKNGDSQSVDCHADKLARRQNKNLPLQNLESFCLAFLSIFQNKPRAVSLEVLEHQEKAGLDSTK